MGVVGQVTMGWVTLQLQRLQTSRNARDFASVIQIALVWGSQTNLQTIVGYTLLQMTSTTPFVVVSVELVANVEHQHQPRF